MPVEAGNLYRTMGVRWWGLGAYERESKSGHAISATRMYAVKPGDLVINKIWVRHGSSAIVGNELDGCVVTADFPTFELDDRLILREWLTHLFKTEWFWTECDAMSRGTSGRQRIDPQAYQEIEIPLPPLDEQQRIVARIEALAGRIAEAQGLQDGALSKSEAMIAGASTRAIDDLAASHPTRPIGETFKFRSDLIRPGDGSRGQVRFIGLQHIEPHTGRRIGEDLVQAEELAGRKFKFSPGEVVYGYLRPYLNKVWIADCEGLCSVDQYVLRPKSETVDTDYLAHFMRSRVFVDQAIERTHSLLLPRLHSGLLASIEIPIPPLARQREVVHHLDNLRARVDALRRLQESTRAELAALLPAVLDKALRGEL